MVSGEDSFCWCCVCVHMPDSVENVQSVEGKRQCGTTLACGTSAAAIAEDTPMFDTVTDRGPRVVVNAEKIHNSLLCTHAKLRATVAEAFAQRLWAAGVISVKEYLRLTLEEVEQYKLQLAAVKALDASLHGVDGLPENLHYRPGTAGPAPFVFGPPHLHPFVHVHARLPPVSSCHPIEPLRTNERTVPALHTSHHASPQSKVRRCLHAGRCCCCCGCRRSTNSRCDGLCCPNRVGPAVSQPPCPDSARKSRARGVAVPAPFNPSFSSLHSLPNHASLLNNCCWPLHGVCNDALADPTTPHRVLFMLSRPPTCVCCCR